MFFSCFCVFACPHSVNTCIICAMRTTLIRISEASRKRLEDSKRETGKSFVNLVDDVLGVDEYTLRDEELNEWVQQDDSPSPPPVSPTRAYAPLPKPSPAVIDAQLLMCWQHELNRRSKKKNATKIQDILLSRKELLRAVRQKIRLGYYPTKPHAPVQPDSDHITWATLYPQWFKNNHKSRSAFQVFCDNRLASLVKQGFLRRVEDGLYRLSSLYPLYQYKNEWAAITGVTLLPPQQGLEIPRLVSITPTAQRLRHGDSLIFGEV